MGEIARIAIGIVVERGHYSHHDKIGKLYFLEEGSLGSLDKRIAWLLAEMDHAGGLSAELDIYWGPFSFR